MSTNPVADEYVGKFYGPEKIIGIEVVDKKTPLGAMIFSLTLEKEVRDTKYTHKELTTEQSLAMNVSDDGSIDYTKMSENLMNELVTKTIELMQEYNISYSQVDLFCKGLAQVLDMYYDRSVSYLFTGDGDQFIPGWQPKTDVSLLDAVRVIDSIPKKDAGTATD